jgi:uncharacterized protein YecE (DUF72 family)
MDFGKVSPEELGKLDLTLPVDHKKTQSILKKKKTEVATEVYVGCAKWGRPDWIGKIYPRGTKAGNFLDEYAKRFNCIELNAIFHQLPGKEQVQQWINKVPDGFLFCPKFNKSITHIKRLKNTETELKKFLDIIHSFGDHLGPSFVQPPPQMGPDYSETILEFLDQLPKDLDVFLELRHPQFFTKPNFDELFSELEKRKKGIIITDSAGRRDCLHMRLTKPDVFIRFVGNSLHPSDYTRIDDWVIRIKSWMEMGLQRCYFFMHHHDELYSPELCRYLISELNDKCGLRIKIPEFVN